MLITVNIVNADGIVEWIPDNVRRIVDLELEKYKAQRGISMKNSTAKCLCIHATSAPSERFFSAAGLTIANNRAKLDSDRANELVFLHEGIPAIEKYKVALARTTR
jgi:hypothetical protein